MNTSIHRAGLAVAALAVVTLIGGFFLIDGYLHAHAQPATGLTAAVIQVLPDSAAAAGTAPPDVVYVRPAPPPAVIHVTQAAPPAPSRIVHVTVPGTGGENEGGAETDGSGN